MKLMLRSNKTQKRPGHFKGWVDQKQIFNFVWPCSSIQTFPKAVNLQECTTDTLLHNEIAVEREQSLTAYV